MFSDHKKESGKKKKIIEQKITKLSYIHTYKYIYVYAFCRLIDRPKDKKIYRIDLQKSKKP